MSQRPRPAIYTAPTSGVFTQQTIKFKVSQLQKKYDYQKRQGGTLYGLGKEATLAELNKWRALLSADAVEALDAQKSYRERPDPDPAAELAAKEAEKRSR